MEAFRLLEIVVEQSQAEKKILFLDELSWMHQVNTPATWHHS